VAIIDTIKFRNILMQGEIAEEASAEEFVAGLNESLEDIAGDLATK
jgi:hypothetical protein